MENISKENQKQDNLSSHKISSSETFLNVSVKDRKSIMIDNFLGGVTWGLGTVIGASIVAGVLGIIIVNTKKVPLIGDVVKIVTQQIQSGSQSFKNS